MTNPKLETCKAVAECTVTKIHGQPTNQDIDILDDELTAIASSFSSELGGGLHGHAGSKFLHREHLLLCLQILEFTHLELFQQLNEDRGKRSIKLWSRNFKHALEQARD